MVVGCIDLPFCILVLYCWTLYCTVLYGIVFSRVVTSSEQCKVIVCRQQGVYTSCLEADGRVVVVVVAVADLLEDDMLYSGDEGTSSNTSISKQTPPSKGSFLHLAR